MKSQFVPALLVVALFGAVAHGQSLGDIAKQEEARRKAVGASGKVYTDSTVRNDNPQPVSVPPKTADKPAATDAGKDAAAAAKPGADESKKDEKYWRQRLSQERDKLARAETFAEALQSRINGLTADFTARDDPFQRNQISADRQKALSELERVRKEITELTKGIADIQEEARKAGVPAGWLR